MRGECGVGGAEWDAGDYSRVIGDAVKWERGVGQGEGGVVKRYGGMEDEEVQGSVGEG